MKVLILSIDQKIFEKGSAVRARMEEYGKLADELHVVVYTKPGFSAAQIAENVFAYPTNTTFRPFYFLDAVKIAHSIPVTKAFLVDSQEAMTNVLGIILKWLCGARLHVQIHTDFTSPFFRKESLMNRLRFVGYWLGIRFADGVRVVSKRLRRSLMTTHYSSRHEPVVLPIFVDPHVEKKNGIDLHGVYPQFSFIILTVSRLTREKNISLGLRAFRTVIQKYPKVGLVIVGDGPEKHTLQRQARTLGIAEQVVFAGWQNDVQAYYQTANCYLVTSNYEGYGMSLVEAAREGCPIVTTDVGVVGDVFVHGESALVTSVGDYGALAECLERLVTNDALQHKLVAAAQRAVANHVSLTHDEYLSNYKRMWERCMV